MDQIYTSSPIPFRNGLLQEQIALIFKIYATEQKIIVKVLKQLGCNVIKQPL